MNSPSATVIGFTGALLLCLAGCGPDKPKPTGSPVRTSATVPAQRGELTEGPAPTPNTAPAPPREPITNLGPTEMSVSGVEILLESHDPDGRARHTMVVKQSMVRDMMKGDTSNSPDRVAAMMAGALYLSQFGRRHLDGQDFERTYLAIVAANAVTKAFPGISACLGEERAKDLPPGWEVPIWVVSWAETEVR